MWNFRWFFECFYCVKFRGGERCLKFGEKEKILDLGVVKNWNMKWIISRQLPDSPPPQQGAFDPINGVTGLCV